MLKILTEIDKSKGYRIFDGQENYKFGSPCILAGASRYLEVSLSDILPNTLGFDQLKMPFVFIPTVNIIKVPVAGVSDEISEMVPGILKEMQISKILEDFDIASRAINDILTDPVPVAGEIIPKGSPNCLITGNLEYYRLDTRFDRPKINENPWPGLHQVSWFGQDLYVCTKMVGEKCYLTILSSPIINQELLVQLINYKYAFKRYGIKTTSN